MVDDPRRSELPIDDELDVDAALADLGIDLTELDSVLEKLEGVRPAGFDRLHSPLDGFEDRVTDRAWRKIRNRQTINAFGDLFGLGWHTARAMFDGREAIAANDTYDHRDSSHGSES